MVSVHENETNKIVTSEIVNELVHTDFASWIGQAERKYPIELFPYNPPADYFVILPIAGFSYWHGIPPPYTTYNMKKLSKIVKYYFQFSLEFIKLEILENRSLIKLS